MLWWAWKVAQLYRQNPPKTGASARNVWNWTSVQLLWSVIKSISELLIFYFVHRVNIKTLKGTHFFLMSNAIFLLLDTSRVTVQDSQSSQWSFYEKQSSLMCLPFDQNWIFGWASVLAARADRIRDFPSLWYKQAKSRKKSPHTKCFRGSPSQRSSHRLNWPYLIRV